MAPDRRGRRGPATALALLLAWELVGRLDLVAGGALPAPGEVAAQLWADRADYPRHVGATLWAATAGFVIGNALAILAGLAFVLWPFSLRAMRGVNVALFALPPIAIAPILVLTLDGMAPRIVLAALGVWFVTMSATVAGLTRIDERAADVVRAYGGGRGRVLRLVRLRSAVPMVLAGLRVAAPNAVLGAILAEFGGGGRWGLGAYLLGSLGRGDPERLWGIGLVATAVAGTAYAAFALLARRVLGAGLAVTLDPSILPEAMRPALALRVLGAALAVALPFALWWAFLALLDVPAMLGKSPVDVAAYLLWSDGATAARARLGAALAQTLPLALLGAAAGLVVAFALALGSRLAPAVERVLLPVALVTQTMPLVALTPLLVLLLGRGAALTLWVTVSVTFFPAYALMAQGLAGVPRAALEVPRAYGASAWREMRLVAVPAAMPFLFAAARVAVPRALLGVMIAEWLATGRGLGNLLNQSRGQLDFAMIWSVAAVSVLVAVALHGATLAIERRVLRRMGMAPTG